MFLANHNKITQVGQKCIFTVTSTSLPVDHFVLKRLNSGVAVGLLSLSKGSQAGREQLQKYTAFQKISMNVFYDNVTVGIVVRNNAKATESFVMIRM